MAHPPFPPGGPYPGPHAGYGQQPAYGQPAGYGSYSQQQPQGAWPGHGPRTVFGVPLAPDERVIYYRRIPRGVVGIIIAGVILLPFFLAGIFLFVRAAKMRKAESHANVVTNRRILTVNGDGQVLQEMPWSEVAGMTYYKRRQARHTVVVHGRNNRHVVFDELIVEVQAFIQHVTSNMRAIDSLPEQVFDVAPLPPTKAGRTALVSGLVMAGLGALTIVFALVAVNESEVLTVGAVGGLSLLAGGVLAAVGLAAKGR